MAIDALYTLTLVDGLETSTADGNTQRYHKVTLRETTVEDEAAAVRLSESVMTLNNRPVLLTNDDRYTRALTMLSIDKFEGGGLPIDRSLIDDPLVGKLSRLDWSAIEQRLIVIDAAAQLRHGLINQSQFDELYAGVMPKGPQSRESAGAASAVSNADVATSGAPELLNDRAGKNADSPAVMLVSHA